MKLRQLLAVSLLGSFLFVSFGDVEAKPRRVDVRQHHQSSRVKQGVQSGELTRKEVHQLNQNRKQIREAELKFKSDGELTLAEKKQLEKMQDRQSKAIYKQKHDDQSRPGADINNSETGSSD